MSIVPSLLQAIVHVDGEAMVMHAGDKPYVVSPTGQVDLASRGLTLDAVNGIVAQLLPSEFQHALDEFGAVQYELPASQQISGEHFTVVAARGGDDVWVEIRRRRVPVDDRVPKEMFAAQSAPAVAVAAASAAPNEVTRAQAIVRNEGLAVPDPVQLRPDSSTRLPESEAVEQEIDLDEMIVASGSTAIKQPSIEQPRLAQSPIEEPIKQPRLEPAAIEKKPTAVDVPVSEFLETRPSPMPA